jgi:Trypsin
MAAKYTDDGDVTVGARMFKFHLEYRYNQKQNPNNMALVKSVAEFDMLPGMVAAIQLPYLLEWLPPGTLCFFSGLGIQKSGQNLGTRRHLRLLNMKILDDQQCKAEFGGWYAPPNFCARALNTAKGDVCEVRFDTPKW